MSSLKKKRFLTLDLSKREIFCTQGQQLKLAHAKNVSFCARRKPGSKNCKKINCHLENNFLHLYKNNFPIYYLSTFLVINSQSWCWCGDPISLFFWTQWKYNPLHSWKKFEWLSKCISLDRFSHLKNEKIQNNRNCFTNDNQVLLYGKQLRVVIEKKDLLSIGPTQMPSHKIFFSAFTPSQTFIPTSNRKLTRKGIN